MGGQRLERADGPGEHQAVADEAVGDLPHREPEQDDARPLEEAEALLAPRDGSGALVIRGARGRHGERTHTREEGVGLLVTQHAGGAHHADSPFVRGPEGPHHREDSVRRGALARGGAHHERHLVVGQAVLTHHLDHLRGARLVHAHHVVDLRRGENAPGSARRLGPSLAARGIVRRRRRYARVHGTCLAGTPLLGTHCRSPLALPSVGTSSPETLVFESSRYPWGGR